MLVLSRQRDQAIMIGDEIEVSVVDVRGDKVRLGIDAPRSVTVHRKEIYEAIRDENRAAAGVDAHAVSLLVPAPANPPLKLVTDAPLTDHDALHAAIEEARKSLSHNGIPSGAVLVRNGKIIGRGHDRRIQRGDPISRAALEAITSAGRQKTYRDTVLYTTLMPCLTAAGAVVELGISKLFVGDTANGKIECNGANSPNMLRACGVEIVDLHDAAAIEMMAKFVQEKPSLWNESLGR